MQLQKQHDLPSLHKQKLWQMKTHHLSHTLTHSQQFQTTLLQIQIFSYTSFTSTEVSDARHCEENVNFTSSTAYDHKHAAYCYNNSLTNTASTLTRSVSMAFCTRCVRLWHRLQWVGRRMQSLLIVECQEEQMME